MAANDKQIGGEHYGLKDFQHWDMVVHFKLDYFQGQITKYVMRWRDKGGIVDLEKAEHFLQKYMEVAKSEVDPATGKPAYRIQFAGRTLLGVGTPLGLREEMVGKKVRAARGKK